MARTGRTSWGRLAHLLLLSTSLPRLTAGLTDRPIIGILTVPTSDGAEGCVTRRRRRLASDSSSPTATSSCFHSYYVDWLEAAGARVVAIPCTAPPALLDDLFDSVNGVLFTGGEESLATNSTYYGAARRLFDRAVAAAATGDRVPIWGSPRTCTASPPRVPCTTAAAPAPPCCIPAPSSACRHRGRCRASACRSPPLCTPGGRTSSLPTGAHSLMSCR